MTEQSPESFGSRPQEPRKLTLQDLLVPMVLPGDEARKRARPNPGFSPEVQAELDRDLAECDRMIIDTRSLGNMGRR